MYDTSDEGVRIVCFGDIHNLEPKPLLRMHSSCLASEVFGAQDCDCADQLSESMKKIAIEGGGIIAHLQQEGRGHGLSKKIKAVNLMRTHNLDTVQAFERLGLEQDTRSYHTVIKILRALNIGSVRLISNNPAKLKFLTDRGIQVKQVGTNPNIRPQNEEYLKTKNEKLNHSLPLSTLTNPTGKILFNHSDQPWGEFSNFSQHPIFVNESIWPTNEHFYQAQKFTDTQHQEKIRLSESPIQAKKNAIELKHHIRENWGLIKEEAMFEGLNAKFTQHPNLVTLLAKTGDCKLVEHSTQDYYWGDPGDGSGQNRLGELLMQVRNNLVNT